MENNQNDFELLEYFQPTNKYYYMVTIKNNTSPKKEYTNYQRYLSQANKLFLRGFHHVKSALELDSKDQLHLHIVCYHDKNINRVKMSNYLKTFEKTFTHDIRQIVTSNHYYNALKYLNPNLNTIAKAKYEYLFYSNEFCDFNN